MDGKYKVRREELWVRDVAGTDVVYATLIIRPLGCPLGLPLTSTNCAGCDEYNGLTFVNNLDSSGFTPVVNCTATREEQKSEDDEL